MDSRVEGDASYDGREAYLPFGISSSHSCKDSPAKSFRVLYSSILGPNFFALGAFIASKRGEDTLDFTTWCYPSPAIRSVSLGNPQADTHRTLRPIMTRFFLDSRCSSWVVADLACSLVVNGKDLHSTRDNGSLVCLTWFHQRFCPLGKISTLDKTWEKFLEMLRKYPHHDFLRGNLSTLNQTSINVACGGIIRKKSLNEAYGIIEDMASNTYYYSLSDRHVTRRPIEVHQVETRGVVEKKLDALTK
ncbi:hypothetical protein CR513_62109, partial [Mucuna pruriens]